MDASDFIYEMLGRHLSHEKFGWAMTAKFTNEAGVTVSGLRGPAKNSLLVTDGAVFVSTKLRRPENLPSHITWGHSPGLRAMAFDMAGDTNWVYVRLSNFDPAKALPGKPVNGAGDMLVLYDDSGRQEIWWSKSLAQNVAGILLEAFSDKKIEAGKLIVSAIKGANDPKASLSQKKALRQINNLIRHYPEIVDAPGGLIDCVKYLTGGKNGAAG
ncbi:hypothetical protein [Sulfuricystis multivorans]|uniref:hypothetical protein n=1 Tax=Sulfuricystis multivorans TaxID=2211108 RepID=UPI000F82E4DA|nr:hypothetical protein [Sulfuricystis multivorans]